MRKLLNSFLVIVIAVLTTSCASMFPKDSDISVSSNEPLSIRVSNEGGVNEVLTTPFTYELNRRRDYTFTVISDKYESEKYVVEKKLRIFPLIADILFSPFAIGLFIDFGSGMIYEHDSKHLIIKTDELTLKKAQAELEGKTEFIANLEFILLGKDKDKAPAEVRAHKEFKFHRVAG